MIWRISKQLISTSSKGIRSFATSSQNEQRHSIIRNHPPLTQIPSLNPVFRQHVATRLRLIEDDTKMRFLIEEGGFAGCTNLGILIKAGAQNQTFETAGSLKNLKEFVHMKPTFEESVKNYEFFHQSGSNFQYNTDSISTYVKSSFFSEDTDTMVDLLLDLALSEKNLPESFQNEDQNILPFEPILRTAFGDKGVGMPIMGGVGNTLTNQHFLHFQRSFITPHQTVISMSNVNHPEKLIQQIKSKIASRYPEFLKRQAPPKPQSEYVGGLKVYANENAEFFQFNLSFPGVSLRHENYEMYNILRVILGEASSFSSGGPGKGMHSRCTKNLLNKMGCVESATFALHQFEELGIFGLTVTGPFEEKNQIISCTIKEFKKLLQPIPNDQLQRAKNILLAQIYTNTEKQFDRLDELSKHLHSYGRIKFHEFEPKIRSVTSEQIQKEMQRIFRLKPTFSVVDKKSSGKAINEKVLLKFLNE